MAKTMHLYSAPLSMFGAKAEIAVLEKDVECRIEHVPFTLERLYEPKHPEVERINPKKQVPVLVDGDLEIYDSTQIFEYLEDRTGPPLWPQDAKARARARLLELESDEVFFPNVILLMPAQRRAAGEERVAAAVGAIRAFYGRREALLAEREYLGGDAFGYADIAFYMAQFFAGFLGEPWAAGHSHLESWRRRVRERASVTRVAGAMADYLAEFGISTPGR